MFQGNLLLTAEVVLAKIQHSPVIHFNCQGSQSDAECGLDRNNRHRRRRLLPVKALAVLLISYPKAVQH